MTGTDPGGGGGGLCGILLRWALLSWALKEVICLHILGVSMQISISLGA